MHKGDWRMRLPERITIADRISYWKARREPLSADIGVIEGDSGFWIYDVGAGDIGAACIRGLSGGKNIVLSHFHADHIGNLEKVTFEKLYQGAYTLRHTQRGEAVRGNLWLEDGSLCMHLFELPSSHAKGCLGLEIDGQYAFLGDGTYCSVRQGRPVYNVGLLQQEIKVLESLRANYFLLSHDEVFVRDREEVLENLKSIYAGRIPGNPYIDVG